MISVVNVTQAATCSSMVTPGGQRGVMLTHVEQHRRTEESDGRPEEEKTRSSKKIGGGFRRRASDETCDDERAESLSRRVEIDNFPHGESEADPVFARSRCLSLRCARSKGSPQSTDLALRCARFSRPTRGSLRVSMRTRAIANTLIPALAASDPTRSWLALRPADAIVLVVGRLAIFHAVS